MLSIVFPIYNEAENIDELYCRLSNVLLQFESYEIIMVNDSSSDNSLEKIVALANRDHRIKLIDFSKNFGHQAAITAGLIMQAVMPWLSWTVIFRTLRK